MGQHYVPRRYLRRFQCPRREGLVWLYDRNGGQARRAAISKIAQEADFYSAEIEAALNHQIEIPSNPAFEKLLNGQDLASDDRFRLALYVATMMKGVPANRLRGTIMAPSAIDSTVEEIRRELYQYASEHPVDMSLLDRRLKEIECVQSKLRDTLPPSVLEQIRSPWPSPEMTEIIFEMSWRVLVSQGPSYFLTSDNPAFFFTAFGLGNQESEISFPLSSTHTLHASWWPSASEIEFLPATPPIVKELNRRQAQSATRFLFYCEAATWVPKLFRHVPESLSRITW